MSSVGLEIGESIGVGGRCRWGSSFESSVERFMNSIYNGDPGRERGDV
jgi:hypothetical protein